MQDGKKKYLSDVFHVLNITKNLVSIGQMVEQGLQVRFNPHGCFVEDMKNKGCLIAKGKKKGRMFTLDAKDTRLEAEAYLHFCTQQQYNERWVYTICVTLEYTVHM